MPNIVQGPPQSDGKIPEAEDVGETVVQAARQIEAGLESPGEDVGPALRDEAAGVGDADDHRACALCRAFLRGDLGQVQAGAAAGKPDLSDAPVAPPLQYSQRR